MATEPPPQRARRTVRGRRAEADGRAAEALAAAALQAAGWTILDRRARTDAGELDLVARRGAVLAFVEVKRRRGAEEALFALSPRQRRRLAAAAACWL
jgi:putative endonuclease